VQKTRALHYRALSTSRALQYRALSASRARHCRALSGKECYSMELIPQIQGRPCSVGLRDANTESCIIGRCVQKKALYNGALLRNKPDITGTNRALFNRTLTNRALQHTALSARRALHSFAERALCYRTILRKEQGLSTN
jgi:hypothetical protein